MIITSFAIAVLLLILAYLLVSSIVDFCAPILGIQQTTETFTGFEYDVIPKGEQSVPPFGYVEGTGINEGKFVSIFPLEDVPESGSIPYGYERVTTGGGDKIVPKTQDAIFAAVQKANTALLGDNGSFKIPVILHLETQTTANLGMNKIRSIMRQLEMAFFNKPSPNNPNITFELELGQNVTSPDGASNINDYIQKLKELKKTDGTESIFQDNKENRPIHLVVLRKVTNSNNMDGSINFTDNVSFNSTEPTQFSANNPTIVVMQLPYAEINNGNISRNNEKKIIQTFCKVLGLDDLTEQDNIMSSDVDGYGLNPIQNITLKQQASKRIDPVSSQSSNANVSEQTQELIDKVEEAQASYTDNYFDTIQYRDSEEDIRARMTQDDTGVAYVIDKDGNRVALTKAKTQPNQLYHTVGSYPFGSANYVPKYDDAVYLSKLTGETTAATLEDTAAMKGGFCKQEANFPLKIDEKCRQVDKNQCASMSCCVLLGGSKCVAGNENGPTMSKYYSDSTIVNRDYYYYQGKCYGHCPERDPF